MQKITFTTNLGNNTLEYIKLLLYSLKVNLDSNEHQIIVFVDADNENTLDYLKSIKHEFKDLLIIKNNMGGPMGLRNNTILTEYAKYDVISYLHSDMVIGPHYDTEILKHIKPGRILSSTRVEPPLHGQSPVTFVKNFGLHPSEFDFKGWNEYSPTIKRDEIISYFFSPITYYKQDWIRIGGYDTVFRRAREDSDLVQRCLHANIELVQTFSANVYHFTCVSSRGKNWFDTRDTNAQKRVQLQQRADTIEMSRFVRKWGTFNHGERKLFKLDIDLVVKNYMLQNVFAIEPFFSRVWLQNETDRQTLIQHGADQQLVANELLSFTPEVWDRCKQFFRLDDYESIYLVGEPDDYSIKVTIDFNQIQNGNQFISNLQNLYDMLIDCESGEYELDNIHVSVKNTKVISPKVVAENPQFDYGLLTFY